MIASNEPLAPRFVAGVAARQARCDEIAGWDALVGRFANARIVHKNAWVRSLEASVGATPLFVIVEKDGDVVGCLPGLLVRIGPLRIFGSPLAGWQTGTMGPAFDPDRISTDALIGCVVDWLERCCNVHHIELINGNLDYATMCRLGFRPEAIPTFRAPLFPGDEALAMRRLKDSARRNVRRAIRLGLTARFETDERFVDHAYEQIQDVFTRGGNTVPFGKNRLLQFFRCMQQSGNLVAISVYLPDGRTDIAAGLFTIDGPELFLWQWAHRTDYRWYRPTEFMTWTVMTHAMAAGCTTFDLMGLGDFKANFGAALDQTQYRWVRSRYEWLTRARDLTEKSYRWQQSLRGRLARRRRRSGSSLPPDSPGSTAHLRDGTDA